MLLCFVINSQLQATNTSCAAECCSSESPYQPTSIDFTSTRKKQGKQSHSFVMKWFKDYTWSHSVSQK